jgi:kynurenine formamidase
MLIPMPELLAAAKEGRYAVGYFEAWDSYSLEAVVNAAEAEQSPVIGLGVETVGTDAGQAATFTPPFPNHAIMHGAGKFGLASLCNLDQLPPTGAVVIAAPLKIVNGSGSPLRVIAIAPA